MESNHSSPESVHIAIIGGGTAGLACARHAIERGARVTLVAHGQTSAAHQRELTDLLQNDRFKVLQAEARFLNAHTLIARLDDDSRKVSFRKVAFDRCLIATGSIPELPSIPGLGATPYWTATEALNSTNIPPTLAVIGTAPHMLELVQSFAQRGSQVIVLTDQFLPWLREPELRQTLKSALESQGLDIRTGVSFFRVSYENEFIIESDTQKVRAARLLVAAGTVSNSHSLCLDMVGVLQGARGEVLVDAWLKTSVPHIYAAGDCTGLPQYAHVAAESGMCAAINMTGGDVRIDAAYLPQVVLTEPQLATVGLTEAEAQEQGLRACSYSCRSETGGFTKMVMEADSLRLLGVHAAGVWAKEVAWAAVSLLRANMTVAAIAEQSAIENSAGEKLRRCARIILGEKVNFPDVRSG